MKDLLIFTDNLEVQPSLFLSRHQLFVCQNFPIFFLAKAFEFISVWLVLIDFLMSGIVLNLILFRFLKLDSRVSATWPRDNFRVWWKAATPRRISATEGPTARTASTSPTVTTLQNGSKNKHWNSVCRGKFAVLKSTFPNPLSSFKNVHNHLWSLIGHNFLLIPVFPDVSKCRWLTSQFCSDHPQMIAWLEQIGEWKSKTGH